MNGSESAIFRTKEKLYALRGQLMVDSPLLGGRAAKPLVWVPCLALALFGLWSFWHAQGLRKNEVDESVYTYIGWSWGEGYWPYLDNWDHKGPAIYLATMLRVALAGTKPEMLGLQQIAVGCATAILLAGIAYDLWGGLSPPMALAFGILIWTQSLPEFDVVATPGSLIGLFSTGAVLAALAAAHHISFRKSAVLVLLMALANGLALCTKPNAIAGSVIGLVAIW